MFISPHSQTFLDQDQDVQDQGTAIKNNSLRVKVAVRITFASFTSLNLAIFRLPENFPRTDRQTNLVIEALPRA